MGESTVTEFGVLKNDMVESCDAFGTLCPSKTSVHTFQCTISSASLVWEIISNGSVIRFFSFDGSIDPIGRNHTHGNFTFILTQAGSSNIKSIAIVSIYMGFAEGDMLRCIDGNDGQSKTCNLVVQGNKSRFIYLHICVYLCRATITM